MGDMADYYRSCQDEYNDDKIKKRKPLLHQTKDGRIVDIRGISDKYPSMEDNHLLNCINYIKKRAKEGVKICHGGGSSTDEMWYDEEILSYKASLKHLKYKKYKKEAKRRNLI